MLPTISLQLFSSILTNNKGHLVPTSLTHTYKTLINTNKQSIKSKCHMLSFSFTKSPNIHNLSVEQDYLQDNFSFRVFEISSMILFV